MNTIGANAKPGVSFLQFDLHGAWDFNFGQGDITPRIDLNENNEHLGGFSEAGVGPVGSQSPGGTHHGFSALPNVEFSYDFHSGDTVIRPYITAGAAWRPDAKFELPFAFVGSLPAAGDYIQSTHVDPLAGTVEAGISVIKTGKFSLTASYQGQFSQSYTRDTVMLRASVAF